MKKILLSFLPLLAAIPLRAQEVVGQYMNSFFDKSFAIEANMENGELSNVYIGVDAKSSRKAYICVKGGDLDAFKESLRLIREKYLDWVRIAKENNITEMSKEFGIKTPAVSIAWYGSKWWFSFGHRLNMKFLIFTNGNMAAYWAPKVEASSNEYIDETIYFVFESAEDFDNLIKELDTEVILKKLQTIKDKEVLFQ